MLLVNYILDISDSTSTKQDLLTKNIILSEASVLASKDKTWSAFAAGMSNDKKCKIHTCKIKSNMFGHLLFGNLNDLPIIIDRLCTIT